MRRTLGLLAIIALTAGITPSHASATKTRRYAAPSTPGLSFKVNPADVNPGEVNAADEAEELEGTPADATPLEGTPADATPLRGTPADAGFGGVTFLAEDYAGTATRLKVVDDLGLPVAWSACQNNGVLPVCGSNAEDVQVSHCTVNDGPTGFPLLGFGSGDVNVWIIVNDSAAIYDDACDGVATQGTVTLTSTG